MGKTKEEYNAYMKEYMANRRIERKAELRKMLGDKCVRCGYDGEELDFDHVVPGSQLFRISGRGLDKKWETILEEVAKCQLLCKPCHRIKTTEAGEANPNPWNKGMGGPLTHGTAKMYSEAKCKCPPCKTAKRMYRNKEISYTDRVE